MRLQALQCQPLRHGSMQTKGLTGRKVVVYILETEFHWFRGYCYARIIRFTVLSQLSSQISQSVEGKQSQRRDYENGISSIGYEIAVTDNRKLPVDSEIVLFYHPIDE